MSRHRIDPRAGWAKPNGKCRWCGKDGLGPRRTFCSEECVHQHKIRTDPGYVRNLVHQRDKGVCAACGLDTGALRASMPMGRYRRTPEQNARLVELGISIDATYDGEFWQADHIVEVVRGGGGCGLENYQTLCTRCHKDKTRELARARKADREAAKQPLFRETP